MYVELNSGQWKDMIHWRYRVVDGNRGLPNFVAQYVSENLKHCTCGRDNCEHVAAVRRMLTPAAV